MTGHHGFLLTQSPQATSARHECQFQELHLSPSWHEKRPKKGGCEKGIIQYPPVRDIPIRLDRSRQTEGQQCPNYSLHLSKYPTTGLQIA